MDLYQVHLALPNMLYNVLHPILASENNLKLVYQLIHSPPVAFLYSALYHLI